MATAATLYATLGVDPQADIGVIQAAYRHLAKKHHPDAGGDGHVFAAIADAYEVLSDETRRRAYDSTLTPSTTGSGGGYQHPRSEPHTTAPRTPHTNSEEYSRPPRAPYGPRYSPRADGGQRPRTAHTRPVRRRRGPSVRFLARTWPGAIIGVLVGLVRVYMFTRISEGDDTITRISIANDSIMLHAALWGVGGWVVGAGACALIARIVKTTTTGWIGPVAAIVAMCALSLSEHPSVPVIAGCVLLWAASTRQTQPTGT